MKEAARVRTQALAPDEPLNFEIIDGWADDVAGAQASIRALREAVLTLPFFGTGKLVWWKNVSFLADTVQGRSASVLEALEELTPVLESLGGTNVRVVMSVTALDGRRRFAKWLLGHAQVEEYSLPERPRGGEGAMLDWVDEQARAAGLEMEPAAVEWLALACGADSMLLASELEKLRTFAGERKEPITLAESRALVHGEPHVAVWDLTDAVLAGDARRALERLEAMLSQGESEVGIVAILSQQIRLAALAAVLREAKLLRLTSRGRFVSADVTPEGQVFLPKKKSGEPVSAFQIAKVAQLSVHQPATHWMRAVAAVHRVWMELISGAADKPRAVEGLIVRLTAAGARAQRAARAG